MTIRPTLLPIWVIIIVLSLPLNIVAQEQQFSFTQYNIKDGLAGSIVHGMCQDKDGFIWFATETGLSRFDGKRFKNYTTADGLPSNEVLGVLPDNKNKVWIVPFKNMVGYYYKGKVHSPTNAPNLTQFQFKHIVLDQGITPNGQVCIKAGGSYFYFDADSNKLLQAYTPTSISQASYNISLLVKEALSDTARLFQYNPYWMRSQRNDRVQVHKNVNKVILVLLDNKLYVSSAGQPVYSIPLPANFEALLPLTNNLIALRLNTGGCLLVDIANRKTPLLCLPEEKINQVLVDAEGNFWFSTNGSGVFKLSSLTVQNYRLYQQKLPRQVINISKWQGQLCIGTDNGEFWQMANGSSVLQPLKSNIAPPGVGPYQHTWARWLQPHFVFKPTPQPYKNAPIANLYLKNIPLKTISVKDTSILLATADGVFYMPTGNINHLDTLYRHRSTCAIQMDKQFFIGTLEGLYIVDSNKQVIYTGNVHPALKSRIGTLGIAQNGTVWIASYGDGLIAWQNGKVVAHITEAQGLSSNNCRAIFIDGNWLWAGTERGLNKIDITGNIPIITKKFNTSDGLASDMINALYVDGAIVYVGTSASLSIFDETSIPQSSICRLNMTGIYVSNQPMPIDSGILQLPHASKNIRFEYAGISFRSADKMLYRYRLLGLDTVWRQSSENAVEFPSLSSGAYEFQLQAINAYGLSSPIISQPFNIKVLLIEKTWVRLVGVLLIGLLIGLLFHFRLHNIRRKERQRLAMNQRLAELEHLALRSQMNPHFIFNSLNAMYQYVIDKDIEGANKFITDFSQLIRLTFELTAQPKITLAAELQYLHTYLELEKVKYEGQFNYAFAIMPGLDTESYFLPPMILQPHVENSIRHGVRSTIEKGQINISISVEADFLICRIDDNGIGRKAAQEAMRNNHGHQSKGMSLTAERISIWSRQAGVPIRVEVQDKFSATGAATGTCITVYIPIREAKNPY